MKNKFYHHIFTILIIFSSSYVGYDIYNENKNYLNEIQRQKKLKEIYNNLLVFKNDLENAIKINVISTSELIVTHINWDDKKKNYHYLNIKYSIQSCSFDKSETCLFNEKEELLSMKNLSFCYLDKCSLEYRHDFRKIFFINGIFSENKTLAIYLKNLIGEDFIPKDHMVVRR